LHHLPVNHADQYPHVTIIVQEVRKIPTDICQMAGQLEAVDGLAGGYRVALDAKTQDTSIGITPQQFTSQIVRRMRLQAEI
jgi:hypothetical protein